MGDAASFSFLDEKTLLELGDELSFRFFPLPFFPGGEMPGFGLRKEATVGWVGDLGMAQPIWVVGGRVNSKSETFTQKRWVHKKKKN